MYEDGPGTQMQHLADAACTHPVLRFQASPVGVKVPLWALGDRLAPQESPCEDRGILARQGPVQIPREL